MLFFISLQIPFLWEETMKKHFSSTVRILVFTALLVLLANGSSMAAGFALIEQSVSGQVTLRF
jgi:hypothetical protein